MLAALLLPFLAQSAPADAAPPRSPLAACLAQAQDDPAAAVETAEQWLEDAQQAERSLPGQCLGTAYARLGEWEAAEQAFLSALAGARAANAPRRARLAAMAGNAALAGGRYQAALDSLDTAAVIADATADPELLGTIAIDRARALVPLGREPDAAEALAKARQEIPKNAEAWLLSAALARRTGDLVAAQQYIETAAQLRPIDLEIGLEAGLIAALAGRDEAARKSWQSVIDADPSSTPARLARSYIEQLAQP